MAYPQSMEIYESFKFLDWVWKILMRKYVKRHFRKWAYTKNDKLCYIKKMYQLPECYPNFFWRSYHIEQENTKFGCNRVMDMNHPLEPTLVAQCHSATSGSWQTLVQKPVLGEATHLNMSHSRHDVQCYALSQHATHQFQHKYHITSRQLGSVKI